MVVVLSPQARAGPSSSFASTRWGTRGSVCGRFLPLMILSTVVITLIGHTLMLQHGLHYEVDRGSLYSRSTKNETSRGSKANEGTFTKIESTTYGNVISMYEHLPSQYFTIIPYQSPPEPPIYFTPKVSERDCNRPELINITLHRNQSIWGHIKTVLPAKTQIEHCLSALTNAPTRFKVPEQPLFVTQAQNAYINENGIVRTANEILAFRRSCFGTVKTKHVFTSCSEYVEDIFVSSHWWGNETGHFIHETLPRIVPYLDLAQKMPVHIHGNKVTEQIQAWFDYLNLTAIHGEICAKNVFVASPADCRGGAFMSGMHRQMQRYFENDSVLDFNRKEKFVLILHRDKSRRSREPIRDVNQLVASLEMAGYENIKVIKSSDKTFWSCISCQIKIFQNAWLLISSHGAGLFNFLFMPVGAYVVEIASKARPEEPYYSSAGQSTYSLGQHYYHYYWRGRDEDSIRLDVEFFVSELMDFAPPSAQNLV